MGLTDELEKFISEEMKMKHIDAEISAHKKIGKMKWNNKDAEVQVIITSDKSEWLD